MKNKLFDCVQMKREAQERIYLQTQKMTSEEKIAYYNKIGAATKKKQAELKVLLLNP